MTEIAVFGSGCFWCGEALFSRLIGVSSVVPGYAGGNMDDPHYEVVSTGVTGHAEVIKITFDPQLISYDTLLDVFWNTHDPTTPDRQGADIGSQYRSLIFYTDIKQKELAEKSLQEIQKKYQMPVVTHIQKLEKFFEAEDYHHDYFKNHPDEPYCQIVIEPKLQKFLKHFSDKVI